MLTQRFHALLIGVGDYLHPRFVSLPATVRDALAIANTLTDPDLCGYRLKRAGADWVAGNRV